MPTAPHSHSLRLPRPERFVPEAPLPLSGPADENTGTEGSSDLPRITQERAGGRAGAGCGAGEAAQGGSRRQEAAGAPCGGEGCGTRGFGMQDVVDAAASVPLARGRATGPRGLAHRARGLDFILEAMGHPQGE